MGWLDPYLTRQKLTIQSTYIDGDLTDFPVLVQTSRITSTAGNKFAITTSDGVTQCYIEIEQATTGGVVLWVKVPSVLAASDTILYLYFEPQIADYAGNTDYIGDVNSTNGAKVWDSNFVLVDHMQDYGDTSHTVDSTSNNNDGTKKGAAEPAETTGKIGNAQNPDGLNDYIGTATESNFDITNYLTLEAWGYQADWTDGSQRALIGKDWDAYILSVNSGKARFDCSEAGPVERKAYWNSLLTAGWHYLVFRFDKDNQNGFGEYCSLFVDGDPKPLTWIATVDSNNPINTNNNALSLCASKNTSLFSDILQDETRISNSARSNAWIKASYYSEINSLIVYGALDYVQATFGDAHTNWIRQYGTRKKKPLQALTTLLKHYKQERTREQHPQES